MQSSVLVVHPGSPDVVSNALIAVLRRRLGKRLVVTSGSAGFAAPMPREVRGLVVLIPPEGIELNPEEGVGRTLLEFSGDGQARIFPVLLPGARMPVAETLPAPLRWFESINAVGVVPDNAHRRALQLLESITNQATLDDSATPQSLLADAISFGFRPMLFGPLWALLFCVVLFAVELVSVVALPDLRGSRRQGGLIMALLWAGGIVSGGFTGRHLRPWGVPAGAAIGTTLPWVNVIIAVSISMLVQTIYKVNYGEFPDFFVRLTIAVDLGASLGIVSALLAGGWWARDGARLGVGGSSGKKGTSGVAVAAGAVGFTAGSAVGWHLSASEVSRFSNFLYFILFLVNAAASGVSIGFLRGLFGALENRRRREGFPPMLAPSLLTATQGATDRSHLSVGAATPAGRIQSDGYPARRVFLSYRRRDGAASTRVIYDGLTELLKDVRVFRDLDAIPFGLDFKAVLLDELSLCDVLVAVVGREWLTAADATGVRMLDREDDFVRLEIEFALSRSVPVVVALVDGATAPALERLPGRLRALADCPIVPVGGVDEIEGLGRAIREISAGGRRRLAVRERLDHALGLAGRRMRVWGLGGALTGLAFGVLATVVRVKDSLDQVLTLSELLLIPACCGLVIGGRTREWVARVGLTVMIPVLLLSVLISLHFLSILPSLVYRALVLGEKGASAPWYFLISALGYAGGLSGALMNLRAVVARRLRRVRVRSATIRVVSGASAGTCLGIAAGLGFVAVFVPSEWPRFYSALTPVAFLGVMTGTAGLIDGLVAGWLVTER